MGNRTESVQSKNPWSLTEGVPNSVSQTNH